MPQMSTIISGAASLGVLAGVVSGIFYLVLSGIRWAGYVDPLDVFPPAFCSLLLTEKDLPSLLQSCSRIRAALQEEEARQDKCVSCGRRLGGPGPNPAPVVCTRCGRTSCFGAPCSRPAAIGWNCIVCHVKREMESSSGSWTDVKSEDEVIKPNGKAPRNFDSETFQVREFIEKLVEKIVGGPLDGVTVGKLSAHPAYNGMFAKYHEPLCQALARLGFALHYSMSTNVSEKTGDTPSTAHSALSQLIERVVLDAEALPNLTRVHSSVANGTTTGTNGKSYEDILSTAVLNKVIDRFQRSNGYLNDVDDNRNFARTSNSYIDDDNRSGSDWSEHSRSERSEPLALKIEEHIEEVTTAYESSGDDPVEDEEEEEEVEAVLHGNRRVPFPEFGVDIIDGNEPPGSSDADSDSCTTDVMSTQSTWEENWLFQRKKLKSARNSHHPVPVPMLVPNPSQEFRALIGGVDADDISDLSECSESVLEEAMSETPDDHTKVLELIEVLNQEPMVAEELSREETTESASRSEDNPTSSSEVPAIAVSEDFSSGDTLVTAPDSLEIDEVPNIDDVDTSSHSPSPSLVQQDRDIPVDYDQIARIDAPPVPRPRTLDISILDQDTKEQPPICPIAEREKAKWNNAIEMKDNPYTPENIAKRSKTKSTFFTRSNAINNSIDFPTEPEVTEENELPQRRYSRDYYVKSAKSPTGEHPSRSTDSPVSLKSEASLEWFATPYRLQIHLKRRWTSKEMLQLPDMEEGGPSHQLESWNDLAHLPLRRPAPVSTTDSTPKAPKEEVCKRFGLPSVKELKKSFNETNTAAKPPIPPRNLPRNSQDGLKKEAVPPKTSEQSLQREAELDYSAIPVSEIITNLTSKTKISPEVKNRQEDIFREVSEIRSRKPVKIKTVTESSQRTDNESHSKDSSLEEASTEDWGEPGKLDILIKPKKASRPVHSLTARSIPKDFREGLKINSQNLKVRKSATVGEVYSPTETHTVPPLNIDLKRRKQFWEEVIAKGKP